MHYVPFCPLMNDILVINFVKLICFIIHCLYICPMKLTKEHILAYLPYNVGCSYVNLSTGKRIKAVVTGWTKSDGVETTYKKKRMDGCRGDLIRFEGHNNLDILDFKLSLRDSKELFGYIKHNGEMICPIIELAKIHGWSPNDITIEDQNGTYVMYGDKFIHPGTEEYYGRSFFEIDSEDFDMDYGFEESDFAYTFYPVRNQIQIYNKLLEWKFDVFNLYKKK